ncbi:DUF4262 domain-containing protein [Microbacterium sp. PRF11]|uniref:DUF4262 domain-containing protein n=1 Tax=Microbacterium sp. PRF11 TaxID=2962593 RepID=UPI002881B4A9|nr:DUF4262 domain-containing protein [Microbacterium sp. PRF11]MDT0117900.1 DUF4262 domain-containing protein [Microbacterium sp. PRF11]
MNPIDPEVLAFLDQDDRRLAETIRAHAVSVEYVSCGPESEPSSFAYTIGLFGLGHPELLIYSVTPGTASAVLTELAERVRDGGDLLPGEVIAFDGWAHRVRVEEVPNPGDIVFGANRFYQRPPEASVPVLQLTWDDKTGHFPDESEYTVPQLAQPRPGTWRA